MIKMNELEKYKENSILKPYLIHIENEVMNILSMFENDKMLRELYKSYHYNVYSLVNSTNQFLNRIRNLIKVL